MRGHQKYSFAADLASNEYAPRPIAQARRKVELGSGKILDCNGVDVLELKHLFKAREEQIGLGDVLFKACNGSMNFAI